MARSIEMPLCCLRVTQLKGEFGSFRWYGRLKGLQTCSSRYSFMAVHSFFCGLLLLREPSFFKSPSVSRYFSFAFPYSKRCSHQMLLCTVLSCMQQQQQQQQQQLYMEGACLGDELLLLLAGVAPVERHIRSEWRASRSTPS